MKQYNNMYYDIINGEVRITGLISDYETSITIPEYIENKPVVRFKDRAFAKVVQNGSLKIIKICGNIIPRFGENPFLGVPKITIYDKEQGRLKSLQEIYYFGSRALFQEIYEAWNGILPNENLTKWYTCFNNLNIDAANSSYEIANTNLQKAFSLNETNENIYEQIRNVQYTFTSFEKVYNYSSVPNQIDIDLKKDIGITAQAIQIETIFIRTEILPSYNIKLTGYITLAPNILNTPSGQPWRYNHIVAFSPPAIVCGKWIGRPIFQVGTPGGQFSSRIRRADFNAEYNTGNLLEDDMTIIENFYLSENGFNQLRFYFDTLKTNNLSLGQAYDLQIKITGTGFKEVI